MTPEAFSELAHRLGPGVQVRSILDAVQFRVGDRAFATLGWPAPGWAVVKLSRKDQADLLPRSDALSLEPGRRRKTGVTLVRLHDAEPDLVAEVLAAAFGEVYRQAGRGASRPADRLGLVARG
ncbi:MmcQ/YjbR family DNA-binding protein [Caulobacter sp. RHG1]|uniref:MmcQ/YjbR family DNA-binding protein n=1 Tax=Caulobacter sp. (strain RHG1) TaxID=2545762 RepID=UPI0015537337|nr:MmcQ/YjbR family DNA-binding protein [Caulobacter sp. RHG1]NQE61408.1 hypothetical protein [Caulobacter sp. RHG1]